MVLETALPDLSSAANPSGHAVAGTCSPDGDHTPVDALIGVQTLAHLDCLIEIEAIAVADR